MTVRGPDSPVRWGILGAGRVARDFAEGLRSVPDARLTAVTSRTTETLETFQALHGAERSYPQLEAFLDDDAVDVIYVATPHHRHAEDSLACIARGRPVVCEKPFTTSAAQASEVVAAARAARVFCMEAMWTRWIPAVRRLRALVASGVIGEILMVTADFSQHAPFDPTNRLFDPAQGGGALLDRAVYGLSLASMLVGPPSRVSSSALVGETGVDEHVTVTLEYPRALAVVTASVRGTGSNEAVIVGSEGTIRVHAPFYRPESLTLVAAPPAGTEPRVAGLRGHLKAAAGSRRPVRRLYLRLEPLLTARSAVVEQISGNGYNYEAVEAQRCIRSGLLESPDMPLDETISVMDVIDRARAAWVGGEGTHGDDDGDG